MFRKKSPSSRRRGIGVGLVAGSLLAGLVLGSAPAALAGSATGANGYFSASGKNYYSNSSVHTSAGQARASAGVFTTSGTGCVPAGWMGVRARLYTGGGSLSVESGTGYNGVAACGYSLSSPTKYTSGSWYGWTIAYGWNGGGYNAFTIPRSPNQSS